MTLPFLWVSDFELNYFWSRPTLKYRINHILCKSFCQPSCSWLLLDSMVAAFILLPVLLNVMCYVHDLHILNSRNTCLRVMGCCCTSKVYCKLGIGVSGVCSSSSYASKELNKEVLPEKVSFVTNDFKVNWSLTASAFTFITCRWAHSYTQIAWSISLPGCIWVYLTVI